MKKLILVTALLCSASFAATAQPIESEPLKPFVPYTLQGETDPMALDSSAASSSAPVAAPSGEFAPLAPADPVPTATIPAQSDMPAQAPINAPVPAEDFPPSPGATSSVSSPAPFYPNNAVSGLPIKDESKFENRIFCTLKVSFGSIIAGPDNRAADKVKAFLDERADKLTYVRSNGEGKEGEFSYCITIDQHNHKAETYAALKALLIKMDVSAPVRVAGKGFTPFTAGGKDYSR